MLRGLNREQALTFEANQQLAYWVAHRYGHRILPDLDDRVQAARIGLWKAILRHDPSKSKLITFAVLIMKHEIHRTGMAEMSPGTVYLEDLQTPPVDHDATRNPEAALLLREDRRSLAAAAAAVPRKHKRKGATWTPSDVADLLGRGHSAAEVARTFGVSRQRIYQIVQTIRAQQKGE